MNTMALKQIENGAKDNGTIAALNSSANTHELSSFNPGNMFLIGYIECARETLRYLTEVEKLPADHPVILKLKMHLYEHYKEYHVLNLRGKANDDHVESQAQDSINNECNWLKYEPTESVTNCSVGEKSDSDLEKMNMENTDKKKRRVYRKNKRKSQHHS